MEMPRQRLLHIVAGENCGSGICANAPAQASIVQCFRHFVGQLFGIKKINQ